MTFTCIVCPNGCRLTAEKHGDSVEVDGNRCPKGKEFAVSELLEPKRTLCTTVKTSFPRHPVLSVRTNRGIPKQRVFDVMKEINKTTLKTQAKRGDVIISNVLGLSADIIATADLDTEKE